MATIFMSITLFLNCGSIHLWIQTQNPQINSPQLPSQLGVDKGGDGILKLRYLV